MSNPRLWLGLLGMLALVAVGCTEEYDGVQPCLPVNGGDTNVCDQDLSSIEVTGGTMRSSGPSLPSPAPDIRDFLEGGGTTLGDGHLVVRGLYKPYTIRCVNDKEQRHHGWVGPDDWKIEEGIGLMKCYADLKVNDYLVGSGPSQLTVLVYILPYWDRDATTDEVAAMLAQAEKILLGLEQDEWHDYFRNIPASGIANVESILFLGPELDASVEGWQVFATWDLTEDDGTVIVRHPLWEYYAGDDYTVEDDGAIEWTLTDFTTEVQAAHTARLADYGGRIETGHEYYDDEDLPMLVTTATGLHAFHVETGNTTHADGPPVQPPPACGLAVPDQTSNPSLMLDCFALLGLKDDLRGTGTLNWSVGTAIADWDGVRIEDGRVVALNLEGKSLSGTVPAGLADLTALEELRLSGNHLTGCIPPALRSIATNDLNDLRLPDCG